ncbi:DUF2948 family protein [Paragemmobacter straminiformis]|uniref:DUF2948 family protein n=1 Tax=Paragemmobacter straminiformis TaxID=2045119 RepID=A0A842IAM8_9RHOB|nr:DUF2948 family protein [Gemmobacter straminiformis]MBC2836715.1 DUF2948 family protein [Gemmobacter straminiformis]
MADARFEDGDETPLRLRAEGPEDLSVISALVQDAVFSAADMAWQAKRHRFALLLNRFRWEDRKAAETAGRGYERVRTLLVVEDVQAVRSLGFDRGDKDLVLSLLSLDWAAGEDGTGRLTLVLAGDGAVALEVEALDVALQDVTRPYLAPSGKVPRHED